MKNVIYRLLAGILSVMLVLPFGTIVQGVSNFTLPDLISDNMLIQRDMPIKLWGYGGNQGDTIKIVVEDKDGTPINKGEVKIADSGFNAELPAMTAGGPYTIKFSDVEGKTLAVVRNVLVGDLWYQSGQSNMARMISAIPEHIEERVNPNPKDDTIRLFFNAEKITADTPATDIKGQWVVADKNLKEYSAVGYAALETIHNKLDIPVGGICTPYSGTSLDSFNNENAGIYKAKLAPVTQFNIKGVMWYQGEYDRNSGVDGIQNKYNTLISLLRNKWNNEKLPFIAVQLPPSPMKSRVNGTVSEEIDDYSDVRVAIGNICALNDNVGMAVAVDLSTTKYRAEGEDPVHPYIKAPLGKRLGNVALSMVYGKDTYTNSPAYISKKTEGNKLTVLFKDTYQGLKTTDGEAPKGFMLAGEDGVYYEAQAQLLGDSVVLTSDKVPVPVNASYGLEKHYFPYKSVKDEESVASIPDVCVLTMNVVNSSDLPVAAFDTATSVVADVNAGKEVETEVKSETDVDNLSDKVVTSGDKTIFYISTDGSDAGTGTIDKPFASFEKARDTIRELRKNGKLGADGVVVYVRGGEYLIKKGVQFTKEDSGTEDAPVVYRNYPGEEVTLTGAINVNYGDFKKLDDVELASRLSEKKAADKIKYINLFDLGLTEIPEPEWIGVYTYTYDMPTVLGKQKPESVPSELIVNGVTQRIARYPNDDYMTISGVISPGEIVRYWWYDSKGTENYIPEEKRTRNPMVFTVADKRVKNWLNAEDLLVYGTFMHSWADQTVPVAEIDPEKLIITTQYPSVYGCAADQRIYFYNLFEELDSPGEYYIDRFTGNLYYYPVEGEINDVKLTLLEEYLFKLRETDYFTIRGFNITNVRAGMVDASYCKNFNLIDCDMSVSGRRAVEIYDGKNCRVANNYFHDVNGGIELIGGYFDTLTHGNNVIENNEFYACDRLQKQNNPAIIQDGVGNYVQYNKIGKADQMLVRLKGNDQTFMFNELYEGVQFTDDLGALYAGRSLVNRGNKIFYNYFHDHGGTEDLGAYGTHGIFLDDWWSCAHINGNVFENITGSGVMLAGSYNTITNNVFVNIGRLSCSLNRSYNYGMATNDAEFRKGLSDVPYLSDVWVERYPEIVNVVDENGVLDFNNNITAKNNILYNAPEPKISAEIFKAGLFENNITYKEDPGFIDLNGRNYMLKPDSRVFKDMEGFQQIPFTRMGMYTDRALHRVRKSAVVAKESPFIINKGKLAMPDLSVITKDDTVYIPVRVAALFTDATVSYDEQTAIITLASAEHSINFSDGGTDNVKVDGREEKLKVPTLDVDGVNYISVSDIADCFGKALVEFDGIYVITDDNELLDSEGDAELIRYYRDILSVY